MSTNFIADAPEPKRASGSITLSWGLLNVPLSVYTGTQDTNVKRKEFVDGDINKPAGRATIDKSTNTIIDVAQVVRMAEADNGVFVELDDDEIAACTGTKNVAEIVTFIKNEDLGNYVAKKVMQARPHRTKGIPDPAAAKAFSLLIDAMTEEGVSALVKVAMRGPAEYAVLTATGDMIFVHSSDGVRQPLPMGLVPITDLERDTAAKLIASIGVATAPKLPDETAKAITDYVNSKAAGIAPPKAAAAPATPEVDIMAQLEASIAVAKAERVFGAPEGAPVEAPAPA